MADYPAGSTQQVGSSWIRCVLIAGDPCGHSRLCDRVRPPCGRAWAAGYPQSSSIRLRAYLAPRRTWRPANGRSGSGVHFTIAIGWTAWFALLSRASSTVRRARRRKTVGLLGRGGGRRDRPRDEQRCHAPESDPSISIHKRALLDCSWRTHSVRRTAAGLGSSPVGPSDFTPRPG